MARGQFIDRQRSESSPRLPFRFVLLKLPGHANNLNSKTLTLTRGAERSAANLTTLQAARSSTAARPRAPGQEEPAASV